MAKVDVSTSKMNGSFGFGRKRTGSLSTMLISLLTASVCVGVQVKVAPFFRRLVSVTNPIYFFLLNTNTPAPGRSSLYNLYWDKSRTGLL